MLVYMHLLTVPAPAHIRRQFPALITLAYLFYQTNPVQTHWQQPNTVRSDAVTLALLMIDNAADRPVLRRQPKAAHTQSPSQGYELIVYLAAAGTNCSETEYITVSPFLCLRSTGKYLPCCGSINFLVANLPPV